MLRNQTHGLLLVASLFLVGVQAAENEKETAAGSKAQTVCPVMGGKINPSLYVDADGKRIYVCCQGCIAAVKKDPAKYVKQLEAQGVTLARLQTTCPVMGGKINRELHVDANGKRIYLCCAGCLAAVKGNPATYIERIEKKGEVVADTPAEGEKEAKGHAGH